MPVYSHSQLSTYEQCALRYKLHYRDRIVRRREGIEAFTGSRVHDALKKCYDDARMTKIDPIADLLAFYDDAWRRNWHDEIEIAREGLTQEHYRDSGRKMIEAFYARHAPFTADVTIDTEMRLSFPLANDGSYQLQGYIDRLAKCGDGSFTIHDYKTSGHLMSQDEADGDRQLALYQIGIKKRWPGVANIRLVWHYLAFDQDIESARSDGQIAELAAATMKLVDEIEAAEEFPPNETGLCGWCEYPDLCPRRKHLHMVESLPPSEYLNEPGVKLVDRYAALRDQVAGLEDEMGKVKDALIDYSRREDVSVIRGTDRKVSVKFSEKLKFPGKSDPGRQELEDLIVSAGKWMEVSQLDTTALSKAVSGSGWPQDLAAGVLQRGTVEETNSVYLARLKGGEG
jgi:putative RecB family exonuclease